MEVMSRFERISEQPAKNNEVLLPVRFLRDFALEGARAKKHVEAQAMIIEPDEGGRAIADVFKQVPSNVKKTLFIDEFSRLVDGEVIYEINRHIPGLKSEAEQLHKEKSDFFDGLRAEGVTINFTNPPKGFLEGVFPFIGRNHIKGADVDGRIFYLGGVNFAGPDRSDFMVKFTGNVAAKLSAAFADIHAGNVKDDEHRKLNDYSELYIDSGAPGKSIILDRAVEMIASANEHIELLSQLPPDGALAQALKAATRGGVKAELITSDVSDANPRILGVGSVMKLVKLVSNTREFLSKSGVEIRKEPFNYVHAKLLLIDNRYGYFGSHNLAQSGVSAGTEEWGIFTQDPELIRNLRARYMDFRTLTDPRLKDVI